MNDESVGHHEEGAAWPYTSLLFFGFFGGRTRGGRSLVLRTTGALLIVAFAGLALMELPISNVAARIGLAVAMIAGVVGMVWAHASYISGLDDLERRIQLEAMALAYGFVMILAFAGLGFELVGTSSPTVRTALFVLWLLLAEPLRGLALVQVARRYR